MLKNKNINKDPQLEAVKKDQNIKLERLQYTKNRIPALLTYLGIIFNVVYYIGIYKINNVFFYKFIIFISVILNLLFLLFGFLSSEGIKSYKKPYVFVLLGLGVLQFVRIFIFPIQALNTPLVEGSSETVINAAKFARFVIYLSISGASMISAGLLGLYKINQLEKSKMISSLNEVK